MSSLLEQASLVVTPNGTKASKLYSVKPTDGSGDMTVVRATTATRVNSSGLIESSAINVPRLDYTGSTCPSILVEPQRTNILLNSETLATQSVSVTAQPYTLSFYGSGTVVLSGTHSATVVGLGTARKTYTFTPTAGTLTLTVTGTCTKGQLEAGSYATSYIPTTSASVTRNADVINKTGISSLIGQTEGTLFLDFYYDGVSSNYVLIQLFDSATPFNLIQYYLDNSKKISFEVGGTGAIADSNILATGRNKIAGAYKNNDFVLYINGTQIGTDTSGSVIATDSITLNDFYALPNAYKQVMDINLTALWKTRLTNTQLAELTTI